MSFMRREGWVREARDDAPFALRAHRCNPACTSIFAIMNAALFRPLPYARPDRLITIVERRRDAASLSRASYPELEDWRAKRSVFAALTHER